MVKFERRLFQKEELTQGGMVTVNVIVVSTRLKVESLSKNTRLHTS